MLSLELQIALQEIGEDLVDFVVDAIKNKPIKRTSLRKKGGNYVSTNFESPVNASGRLARSISYSLSDKAISVTGEDYINDLIYGKPPSSVGLSDIVRWVEDKGIESEIEIDQLATLIKDKIEKFGDSIFLYNNGNDSGLLENVLTDQKKSEYIAKLAPIILQELIKTWQQT